MSLYREVLTVRQHRITIQFQSLWPITEWSILGAGPSLATFPYAKACLVIVIGILPVVNAQDRYCSENICFIRPDLNFGRAWTPAQQTCKDNNATLPIADTPSRRMSFINALNYFQLNGNDVWLGATASDDGYNKWSWLDGSQYNGPDDVQQRGEYSKSYAYVSKKEGKVLAYAFPPNNSYSYICQCNAVDPGRPICTNGTGRTAFEKERGCFVKYDEQLSWFNARNKCLENSCDLASVSQLSLLDGMVDSNSSGYWVGLRTSQWNWQNAVTGVPSDVTFTSWRIFQPNDAAPNCMATDRSDFPNWKDAECTNVFSYICQVLGNSSSGAATGPSSTAISTASTSFSSTTTSTTTTKSLSGTPGTGSTSASLSAPPSSNTTEPSDLGSSNDDNRNSTNSGSVNVRLAIGLGVGLGVFFIIIIVVVVVVAVVIPRKRRNSAESGNAKSTKKFVTNTSDENRDDGTTERSENKKKGRTQPDESVGQYATVKSAYTDANIDYPANTAATVYADLRFNPDEP